MRIDMKLTRALGLLVVLGAAGCGGGTKVLFELAESATTPFGDVPFPSDLYMEADGTLVGDLNLDRIVERNGDILTDGMDLTRGWSRISAGFFFLDGAFDADSLPADGELVSEGYPAFFLMELGTGTRIPIRTKYLPSLNAIAAIPEPGTVLAGGTTYAYAATDRLTGEGKALVADKDFKSLRSTSSRETEAELLYGGAMDDLVTSGVIEDSKPLVGLSVFTTDDGEPDLMHIRDVIDDPAQYAPPQLTVDPVEMAPFVPFVVSATTTPTLDEWLAIPEDDMAGNDLLGLDPTFIGHPLENMGGTAHDSIGAVVNGAFPSASFLDANGHVRPEDGSAPPELVTTDLVPVTFIFPSTPPPPGGYPTILFAHTFSGQRAFMFGFANDLCRAGYAVVGIDTIFHGLREAEADELNTFLGTYDGPDGFSDQSGDLLQFFGFLENVITIRDNFRQGFADLLALTKLLRNPLLDLSAADAPLGFAPAVDADNLFFYGRGLGADMGLLVAPYAPEINGFVLHGVTGGFFGLRIANSGLFDGLVSATLGGVFAARSEEAYDSFDPVLSLTQLGFDRADPFTSVSHVIDDPLTIGGSPGVAANILLISVIGDDTLANRGSDAVAAALGLPVGEPAYTTTSSWGVEMPTAATPVSGNLADGATGAIVHYAPAGATFGIARMNERFLLPGHPTEDVDDRFPLLIEPVYVDAPITELFEQIIHFFDTASNAGTAEIITTAPPRHDYDNDGVLDDDETAAGTDPFDPASN